METYFVLLILLCLGMHMFGHGHGGHGGCHAHGAHGKRGHDHAAFEDGHQETLQQQTARSWR